MQRILFLSLFMICMSLSLRGQSTIPNYELNVRLDTANDRLYVKQKITFKNTEDTALNQLILNDWAHAYSSTKSALADRLVEEYNRDYKHHFCSVTLLVARPVQHLPYQS